MRLVPGVRLCILVYAGSSDDISMNFFQEACKKCVHVHVAIIFGSVLFTFSTTRLAALLVLRRLLYETSTENDLKTLKPNSNLKWCTCADQVSEQPRN